MLGKATCPCHQMLGRAAAPNGWLNHHIFSATCKKQPHQAEQAQRRDEDALRMHCCISHGRDNPPSILLTPLCMNSDAGPRTLKGRNQLCQSPQNVSPLFIDSPKTFKLHLSLFSIRTSHPWKFSRPGWTGIEATSWKVLLPMAGGGTRGGLRSLLTQTNQGFHDKLRQPYWVAQNHH